MDSNRANSMRMLIRRLLQAPLKTREELTNAIKDRVADNSISDVDGQAFCDIIMKYDDIVDMQNDTALWTTAANSDNIDDLFALFEQYQANEQKELLRAIRDALKEQECRPSEINRFINFLTQGDIKNVTSKQLREMITKVALLDLPPYQAQLLRDLIVGNDALENTNLADEVKHLFSADIENAKQAERAYSLLFYNVASPGKMIELPGGDKDIYDLKKLAAELMEQLSSGKKVDNIGKRFIRALNEYSHITGDTSLLYSLPSNYYYLCKTHFRFALERTGYKNTPEDFIKFFKEEYCGPNGLFGHDSLEIGDSSKGVCHHINPIWSSFDTAFKTLNLLLVSPQFHSTLHRTGFSTVDNVATVIVFHTLIERAYDEIANNVTPRRYTAENIANLAYQFYGNDVDGINEKGPDGKLIKKCYDFPENRFIQASKRTISKTDLRLQPETQRLAAIARQLDNKKTRYVKSALDTKQTDDSFSAAAETLRCKKSLNEFIKTITKRNRDSAGFFLFVDLLCGHFAYSNEMRDQWYAKKEKKKEEEYMKEIQKKDEENKKLKEALKKNGITFQNSVKGDDDLDI